MVSMASVAVRACPGLARHVAPQGYRAGAAPAAASALAGAAARTTAPTACRAGAEPAAASAPVARMSDAGSPTHRCFQRVAKKCVQQNAQTSAQQREYFKRVSLSLNNEAALMEQARRHFTIFDSDHSGTLDFNELTRLVSHLHARLGIDEMDPTFVPMLLKAYDTNNILALDFSQFTCVYKRILSRVRDHVNVVDVSNLITSRRRAFMQDYQIGREIGRGAFGTVNLAVDKSSGVTRVVKTVPAHGANRSAARAEFERIRQFSHPNVVRAIEFYESPVSVQLVCEHCAGGDLYAVMRIMGMKFGQIDTRWIASAMRQVFLAVGYLHQQHQLVHNDLKPDNILLDRVPEGPMDLPRIMVGDFGQSALFGVAQTGDPRYCSPEAHRLNLNMGDVPGPKGDVWMLGVTLYELLSGGRLPFLDRPCSLNEFRTSPSLQHRLIHQGCLGHLEPNWSFLSGNGRRALHFVQTILVKDERQRSSLPTCLRHQWFEIAQERAAKPMDPNAMRQLAERARKSHVHKALRALFATQLQGLELSNFKDVWQEIDKDNSGTIDKNEFVSYMVRQGLGPLEAGDLFHAADLSSDGSINFNEFVGILFDPLANEAELQQHILGVFRKIDRDSSGEISFAEMCALFGPTMSQQVILEIFQDMDTDKSGTISLHEFMSFVKTL